MLLSNIAYVEHLSLLIITQRNISNLLYGNFDFQIHITFEFILNKFHMILFYFIDLVCVTHIEWRFIGLKCANT